MGRQLATSLCICLATGVSWAQDKDSPDAFRSPGKVVIEDGNKTLAAGSQALSAGDYEEGIRLTRLGLEQSGLSDRLRTSALSNLCAAYAATKRPDEAIGYCSQALEISPRNWRAFSNRAFAHWLKGMHTEAASDLAAAADINPGAAEIEQIRGLINQSTLQPRVSVEDRQ